MGGHVIVISLDTTRSDHIGALGSQVRTPCLDSLAAGSVVFTRYYTVVPSTLASHVSLFTGRYPHHHGVVRNGFIVNPANHMLAEILKEAGFRTAGFAGSFALDRRFGIAQGFDAWDQELDQMLAPGVSDQNQRSASAVTDAVVRYLDSTAIPEHLFLFVHYFDPHWPYAPPPPFDTMYDPRGREGLPSIAEIMSGGDLPGDTRLECMKRHALQYAGEVSWMDQEIGRLVRELRSRGILDDAVVVVASDHGESFWEHEEVFGHGSTLYEPATRAVLFVRLPHGERAGTRIARLTGSIDVLPTLLRILGLRGGDMDGDPVDLLAPGGPSDGATDRLVFAQATQPWEGLETDPVWASMRKARSVFDGRYKLVETPYRSREELFDLVSDPGERVNRLEHPSADDTRRAAQLRSALDAWADSAAPLASRFDPSQHEETLARLRSLGYIR